MNYETLNVRWEDSICYLQLYRLSANNTINGRLISECHAVLRDCELSATVVVLSGSAEVFCFGADFTELTSAPTAAGPNEGGPGPLYDVWLQLATGPYISIAHVRGRANAGGVGFAAACDIVLADETAQFSLSELLFGLFPACVLPFLIRRMGFQRAHYLTLTTQPISAGKAQEWGLVDALEPQSEVLLRRNLMRLRRLNKTAIARYKRYAAQMSPSLAALKSPALAANLEVFSDPANLEAIARYVRHGIFPWEKR